jgi:mevalonate kinase
MNINFSAPSKTFLAGEYAVLAGGPALIFNTEPRFTFTAVKGETGSVLGIPAGSPAAIWIEQRSPLLKDWKIEFSDPHAGRGGFGASSAQFLFVHALSTLLQISVSRAVEGLDLKALWNDFKVLSGGRASGADLMAQATGGVALVHGADTRAEAWPFPDLEFAVLRTGNKVATHQHLQELDRGPLEHLIAPANLVTERFSAGSADKFVQSVQAYSMMLRELHLQAPSSLALLKKIEEQTWCKAAKGCGALGADTLLVFFAREDGDAANRYFADLKLERMPSELSEGLQMKWSWS